MATKKIGDYSVGIKYEIDKASVESAKNSLLDVMAVAQQAKPGNAMKESLEEASVVADKLYDILDMSFNKDLGTLNITKFNQLMSQSGLTVEETSNKLIGCGNQGAAAFAKISSLVMNTKVQIKETNKLLSSMFDTFTNTLKWGIASSAMNTISGSIQRAYGYVQDLDKSLNDIRIVTGKSADDMEEFAVKANNAAKALGQTTTAYTEASLIYYQQGLGDAEAQARADVTLKAANVTGQSAQQVSEQLTAVWNGYKVSAEEAELYIDRLAAVAANSASNLEELSIGMSKVASAAYTLGVGEDQLAAQISTIISATRQAPESVGTALKTIYARMSDIKMGNEDAEITLGNYTAKMAQMGINVLDANNELRNMGEVIEEIGGKWQYMSEEQKVALAQTMAGTRQYSNLMALFNNWEQYSKMMNIAADAQGTLQKQEDIYMESTAAHLKQLKATWEDLYAAIFKTDEMNALIDLGTNLVQVFDNFFDSFGGGAKSIVAFGAIIANVFRKNISNEIIKAKEAALDFQNTQQLMASKRYYAEEASKLKIKEDMSPAQAGAIAKAQEEAKSLKEIDIIQGSISEKQYNRLMTAQEELSTLKGQEAELKQQEAIYIKEQKKLDDILKSQPIGRPSAVNENNLKKWRGAGYDNEAKSLDLTEKINKNKQLLNIYEKIEKAKIEGTKLNDKEIQSLTKECELTGTELNNIKKINDYDFEKVNNEKYSLQNKIKELENTKNAVQLAKEQYEIERKISLAQQNMANEKFAILDTSNLVNQVNAGITALSGLSSAIMGVNSLFQIWKDEEATLGEKLLQTFMSLGFVIPSVVSSVNGFKEAFNGLKSIMLFKNALLSKETQDKLKDIEATTGLSQAEKDLTKAVQEGNYAQYKRLMLDKNVSEARKTQIAEIVAQTEVTKAGTAANKEFALSMLIGPQAIIAIAAMAIASLAAVVAIISAVDKAIEKHREELIEEGKATKEEIDNINTLKDAYEDLKKSYDENGSNKEELITKAKELSEALKDERLELYAVTGQWEKYNEVLEEDYQKYAEEAQHKLDMAAKAEAASMDKSFTNSSFYAALVGGAGNLYISESYKKLFDDIVYAFTHFSHTIEQFKNLIAKTSEDIDKYFKNTFNYIKEAFPEITNIISAFLDLIKNSLDNNFYDNYSNLVQSINNTIQNSELPDWLKEISNILENSIQYISHWEGFLDKLSNFNLPNGLSKSISTGFTAYTGSDYTAENKDTIDKIQNEYNLTDGIYPTGIYEEDIKRLKNLRNAYEEAKEKGLSDFANNLLDKITVLEESTEAATNAYKEAIGNRLNSEDFKGYKDVESYEDYKKQRKDAIDELQKEYQEVDIEDITDVYDTWASNNENLKKFAQQLALSEAEKNKILSEMKEKVSGSPEFFDETGALEEDARKAAEAFADYIAKDNDKLTFISGLELDKKDYAIIAKYANNSAKAYEEIFNRNFEQIKENFKNNNAELLSSASSTLYLDIQTGKIDSSNAFDSKEYQAIAEQLGMIKKLYPELIDEVAILSNANLAETESFKKSLNTIEEYMGNLTDNKKIKEVSDEIKELFDLNLTLDDEEFKDKLDDILDKDYSIAIEIDAENDLDFDEAMNDIDSMRKSVKLIGEDFIVSADDVRELGDAFPGILEDYEILADGTLKLNKEVTQKVLEAKKEEIIANNNQTISELENNKIRLESQKAHYEAIGNAMVAYGESKINLDEAQLRIEKEMTEMQEDMQKSLTDNLVDNLKISHINVVSTAKAVLATGRSLFENLGSQLKSFTNAAGQAMQSIINGKWEDLSKIDFSLKPSNFIAGAGAALQKGKATYKTSKITTGLVSKEDYLSKGYEMLGIANAMDLDINDAEAQIAQLKAQNAEIEKLTTNAASGKGNGKSKSGSSKDPDFIDYLEDERDRYHDINIQIKECENEMEKLSSQQKKLMGKGLADNLMKQTAQLQKQILLSKEKLKIQQQEAAELKATLSGQGVTFDDEGNISNYGDILVTKLNYVNQLTEQYNKMSASEQENFKAMVEAAQKDYENFKDNIDRYDELISKEMPEILQTIQDLTDQKIDLQIEAFSIEINAKLDLAEAQRQWNKFLQDVVYGDQSAYGNAQRDKADLLTYYNPEGNSGIVGADTKRVNELLNELQKMESGDVSGVYGDNKSKLLEDLKTANDQLMSDMTNFEELVKSIEQDYLDAINDVADAYDTLNKEFEFTSSLIQHDMKVIEQLYGEDYEAMGRFYDKQVENNNKQVAAQREAVNYWENLMNKEEKGSEAWLAYKENWENAVDTLNSTVESSIQNLLDKYQNSINKIMEDMNNNLSGGKGLNHMTEEWDLITKQSKLYLDNIEGAYEVSQLQSKYMKTINETDNLNTQKKLNDLMEEELSILREKDKLSQYDIDRANAKYDLALKQIALEEAQQNKSQMRLRRDSQGNYSYQYVADNDAIGNAEDEYNKALNNLYKMDKDEYNNNLNEIFNYYQEWQNKIAEAALIKDEEERNRMYDLYNNYYGEIINGLVEQNETAKQNLYESTSLSLQEYYKDDVDAFEAMTSAEKMAWMGEEGLIPSMLSGVQNLVDELGDPQTGFPYISEVLMGNLKDATIEYIDEIGLLSETANQNFEIMRTEGIDPTIDKMEQLIQQDINQLDEMQKQLDKTKEIKVEVDNLVAAYGNAKTAGIEAASAAQEAWKNQKSAVDELSNSIQVMINKINEMIAALNQGWAAAQTGFAGPQAPNGGGGGGSSSTSSYNPKATKTEHSFSIYSRGSSYGADLYYLQEDGKTIKGYEYTTEKSIVEFLKKKGITKNFDDILRDSAKTGKGVTASYDTGGYTGDWNSSKGKMAMLHEKELVLNKEDTGNILTAVNSVRNMGALISALEGSVLSRVGSLTSPSFANFTPQTGSNSVDQNVTITAEFPNATNRNEIEEALTNLVNVASQHAFNTRL